MERPLPSTLDGERAVLGAAILNGDSLSTVLQALDVGDFMFPGHQAVFTALLDMSRDGAPVELASVIERLGERRVLAAAGGAAGVAALIDGVPNKLNVKHFADVVKGYSRRRALIHAANAIQQEAFAGNEPVQSVIEAAAKTMMELMSAQGNDAMPATWASAISGAMDEVIGGIRNPEQVMRLLSGIPKLDEMTAGLRREDLVLIVGGTSHGKSTLAQQYAVHADNAEYKGLIFSAEMSKEAIAKRELAHTAEVPLYLLRRPERIHQPQVIIEKLLRAAAKEMKRALLVVDHDITPSRVWSISEMVAKSQGLDFIIVDYDQLVVREGLSRHDNEYAEQARFVSDALELAKRLHVCFILLCQPRKMDVEVASGKRAPRIEEIFGSSAVANTAHHVIWVIRRFFQKQMNKEHEGEAAIYILKARNDKAGHVDIGFDSDQVLFVNDPPLPEAEEPSLPYRD